MTTVKIFKQGDSLAITIPRSFRSMLHLVKGDLLVVERDNGRLTLTPIRQHLAQQGDRPSPPGTVRLDRTKEQQ